MLDQQNINVVSCVLSIFPEWQDWNRKNFSQYYEIYIYSSIERLKKYDDKGIYGKAKKGDINNVVGLDIPFPEPKRSNLVIEYFIGSALNGHEAAITVSIRAGAASLAHEGAQNVAGASGAALRAC